MSVDCEHFYNTWSPVNVLNTNIDQIISDTGINCNKILSCNNNSLNTSFCCNKDLKIMHTQISSTVGGSLKRSNSSRTGCDPARIMENYKNSQSFQCAAHSPLTHISILLYMYICISVYVYI